MIPRSIAGLTKWMGTRSPLILPSFRLNADYSLNVRDGQAAAIAVHSASLKRWGFRVFFMLGLPFGITGLPTTGSLLCCNVMRDLLGTAWFA